MAFNNTVLADVVGLPAGEVLKASPHNVSAFDVFEDGLIEGRFVKYDSGSIDNLDGSATPVIAGISRRKVTGEIGPGTYRTEGEGYDSVAEVINFGYGTVSITEDATPEKYDPVNVINAVGDEDNGLATDAAVATGIISAGDVVFWEEKQPGVWLVRINKYL